MTVIVSNVDQKLAQLVLNVQHAGQLDFHDHIQRLHEFCATTPILRNALEVLPPTPFDFNIDFRFLDSNWPRGNSGITYRWDAIRQIAEAEPNKGLGFILGLVNGSNDTDDACRSFAKLFVAPVGQYLLNCIENTGNMLYRLERYQRHVLWFEAETVVSLYEDSGEEDLDKHLRRYLFESGVDYPFSQPKSPGGRADVVADLDTDDPLVVEIKIWDSKKGYKINRVRGGLRQVLDYASKYGKDTGYLVLYNADPQPIVFQFPASTDWPRLEISGVTVFFVVIDIYPHEVGVSERDKGRAVTPNIVTASELVEGYE
jgi:hypothetical protein